MTNAPAGWYPDPEDASQQRYWDGGSWTAHRLPATPQQQPPRPTQPAWGQPGQPFQQGQYGGGYAPALPTASSATAALVCGILSLVLCAFFTGIPAMILGRRAKREIEASAGQLGGEGIATAGFVTGLIGTLLYGIPLLIILAFAIGGIISASAG